MQGKVFHLDLLAVPLWVGGPVVKSLDEAAECHNNVHRKSSPVSCLIVTVMEADSVISELTF